MQTTDSDRISTNSVITPVSALFAVGSSQRILAHREIVVPLAEDGRSQARLRGQIQDLITKDRLKDETTALLLHELRSPLASIQNAIAILRVRSQDQFIQQSMHELIERQVRQIALLTASLCQVSGPRLEYLQPQLERIDLCKVLRRAAETVAPEITERLHELVVDLPDRRTWVLGDAGRLEQVFVNLLSNASKYSNAKGKILLSMQVCDGNAVVQVRDFGIGIATDGLPYIFELFVRGEGTAVRKRSGMGIGLALVRSILDSHHGSVSAASEGLGLGSEFTVRLKLES